MPTAALVTSGKTSMPCAFSAAALHAGICATHCSRAALTPASISAAVLAVAEDITASGRMPQRPAATAASRARFMLLISIPLLGRPPSPAGITIWLSRGNDTAGEQGSPNDFCVIALAFTPKSQPIEQA